MLGTGIFVAQSREIICAEHTRNDKVKTTAGGAGLQSLHSQALSIHASLERRKKTDCALDLELISLQVQDPPGVTVYQEDLQALAFSSTHGYSLLQGGKQTEQWKRPVE